MPVQTSALKQNGWFYPKNDRNIRSQGIFLWMDEVPVFFPIVTVFLATRKPF